MYCSQISLPHPLGLTPPLSRAGSCLDTAIFPSQSNVNISKVTTNKFHKTSRFKLFNVSINQNRNYSDDADKEEPTEDGSKDALVMVEKLDSLHIMTIGINRPDKRNAVDY